jgi:nucleotide-binding universal stress UspA family protein
MYEKILVPLDGSELAECVLPHVEAFIKDYHVNNVVLVQVVEPPQKSSYLDYEESASFTKELKEREEDRRAYAKKYLDQVMNRLEHEGTDIHTEVIYGRVADEVTDYAAKNAIDLILIATHGRSGISRWVRGSIADKILHTANAPVLMVRAPGTKERI